MIYTLENEKLCVAISDAGAELQSIYDKEHQREVLWQGDPAFWKRRSPVLFPNVGKHYGNHYRIGGAEYPSSQHGFARDLDFQCISQEENLISFRLLSTEKTKELYPFDFELIISYRLDGGKLQVLWEVKNSGKETLYFTIGGHPAFRVPVLDGTDYHQYSLFFEEKDTLTYSLLDVSSGTLLSDTSYTMELSHHTYPLSHELFYKDALVFDGTQISQVGLLLPDGTPYLEMTCRQVPNFGIWAAPNAPFVCLEPWMGRCDDYGYTGDLSEKENINAVESGKSFRKDYTIHIF